MSGGLEIDKLIARVELAETTSFSDLVRIAKLKPKVDFRYANLKGLDLSKEDLRQFDFSGADLRGCTFKDALINGACFEGAAYDAQRLREAADWDAWARSRGGIQAPPINEPVDAALGRWAHVSQQVTEEVEARYRGLWRVVRASSPPTATEPAAHFDLREINCSLLNIRPRAVGGGTLCDFKLYYLGRGRQPEERLHLAGFVLPNVDRLEFFARAENRNDVLTLMVWRFMTDPGISKHANMSEGLSLALNTSGGPVAARVRAFFVAGSERLANGEFEALKNAELQKIGVRSLRQSRESVIPADHLDETTRYLKEYKPIVGFFRRD